jgi:hypothetical protein
MDLELQHKIVKGEIDINNKELFMGVLFKALLNNLNSQMKLRDKTINHFIINTGDDIMWLENKGQDNSKEPYQVSNEDYVYNTIPRCIANIGSIEVLEEQVTNPYTRGNFEIDYDDILRGFSAEFRRVPIKMSVDLKYYLDSFSDVLFVTQKIISEMLFIRTFKFEYLGQTIQASYKVPTSYSHDKNITFDGGTTEQKLRTIEISLDVETNIPVFDERTAIDLDNSIKSLNVNIGFEEEEYK